jgi:hypothetical protein
VTLSEHADITQIRYWFYVFFVFWDLFEFVFIYFFFVETKGRTLEELDEIFEAKDPRKASTQRATLKKQTIVNGGDNAVTSIVEA